MTELLVALTLMFAAFPHHLGRIESCDHYARIHRPPTPSLYSHVVGKHISCLRLDSPYIVSRFPSMRTRFRSRSRAFLAREWHSVPKQDEWILEAFSLQYKPGNHGFPSLGRFPHISLPFAYTAPAHELIAYHACVSGLLSALPACWLKTLSVGTALAGPGQKLRHAGRLRPALTRPVNSRWP